MSFALHPRLAADCHPLGALTVCDLLLMNDARFPWCVLVPRVADARELHALPHDVAHSVFDEITQVTAALERACKPLKMNVAALGNQVSQLHIHIIARNSADAAWPAPVWGVGQAVPYTDAQLGSLRAALQRELATALQSAATPR